MHAPEMQAVTVSRETIFKSGQKNLADLGTSPDCVSQLSKLDDIRRF
jgi:hypothetical protein